VNSQYRESDASVSADGLSLFFTSTRPGGFGNSDIWMSSRTSLQSSWEEPQNLGSLVNSSSAEETASVSPDGLTLFFGTKREGTQFTDLWAASRDNADSPWESPVNLGPKINTSFVELSPQLSADGSTFYFSRWTNNNEFDIYSIPVLPAEPLLGDLNLDGEVNGLDVDPFVTAVVGGVQQIPEPSTLLLALVALGVIGGWRKWGG
jgi:Tol biopolymer transport system component